MAVGALWVRSYAVADYLGYRLSTTVPETTSHLQYALHSIRGQCAVEITSYAREPAEPRAGWPRWTWHSERLRPGRCADLTAPHGSASPWRGLYKFDARADSETTVLEGLTLTSSIRYIEAPHWALCLVFIVLPAMVLRLWRKSRLRGMRLRLGLCPRCGYDLRATSGRCPECGHAGETDAAIKRAG
jgi:hypothetical protein